MNASSGISRDDKPVVVIGTGFGGLAAAIRLRAMGHSVLVLEAADRPGGRAQTYVQDGFTFDAGPTVVTAPYLFEELFDLVGRDMRDYFELLPVDPFYRVAFPDGSSFDYVGDEERLLANIAEFNPADVDGYRRMVKHSQRIFEIGYSRLADASFDQLTTMLRVVPDMLKLGSYRSVYGMVASYIKDERLRQAFTFQPLLIGGSPFRAPSIYLLIHWVERKWGVHFARGGTGSIVKGMVRLLEDLDVEVRYDSPVQGLEIQDGRAIAVRTEGGERIPCQFVVANADPSMVYTRMVAPQHRRWNTDRAIARKRHSMSLVVAHFGVKGSYPDLAHHTIIMGPRYKELIEDIFERKVLADDFSLYLHAPCRTDPSLAPEGHETFYVLSPVPNQLSGIAWHEEREPYTQKIIEALDQSFLPDLKKNLVTSYSVDPRTFEFGLRSYAGAAFGLEPVLTQSAYFRYHNVSRDVDGLYFVGASTHPGAGIPGVLNSAKVLENILKR